MVCCTVRRVGSVAGALGLAALVAACSPVRTVVPCVVAPPGHVIPDEKWTPYDRCPELPPVVAPAVPGGPGAPSGPTDPGHPPSDPRPPKTGPEGSAVLGGNPVAIQGDEFSRITPDGPIAGDGINLSDLK